MSELDELRTFVRAAETGGFTAAARSLGLTQTIVSRRIKALEERLGVALFHRTTRAVTLTPDGIRYFERVAEPVAALNDAASELTAARDQPSGLLRISAPIGFGAAHVTPAVRDYLARYPLAQVALTLTDRRVDMVSERVDVAVRIGDGAPSEARRIGLGDLSQVLVAAPNLAASLSTVDDLETVGTVVYSAYTEPTVWRLSRGAEKRAVALSRPRFEVDCVPSVLSAALDGLGVTKMPLYAAAPALAQGRLVRVLPDWSAGSLPLAVLTAPGGAGVGAGAPLRRDPPRAGAGVAQRTLKAAVDTRPAKIFQIERSPFAR